MSIDSLQVLEFDAILERLGAHCEFSVARERAGEIGPSGNPDQVRYLQRVTREAVELLTEHPDISVRGVRDIRDLADRSAKGMLVAAPDLRLVLDTIQASQSLRRRLMRFDETEEEYPELIAFAEAIALLPSVEATLSQTVSSRGEILDTASPDLARIRSEVKVAHRRLTERINRVLTDANTAPALQEPIITIREGRYVVPVRADRRSSVRGVVHGTSSSGQTLFVEPMAVVDLNNRWRELQMSEEHEVERILRACSDLVGQHAAELKRTVEAAAAIDLAFAKARYAFELNASAPSISDSFSMERQRQLSNDESPLFLDEARHPLLDQSEVVPLTIHLGSDFRILVITGPNTGGKTVALKTVGLLSLMAQSGLFVPARDGSRLPVFSGVYADIGDEQSIEQSLSTFSSHMTRIVRLLRSADAGSLVLLDEIGAGTDPQEGSALAQAIINALLERQSLGIVTTHYTDLKSYAYTTDGVENASVEFDITTLQPTYRLLIGIPGRSNALSIAERLGLPQDVLEVARSYVEPGAERTDEMVEEIKRQRDLAHSLREEARKERKAADTVRQQAEDALRAAEQERAEVYDQVMAELGDQIAEAKRLVRRLESSAMARTQPMPQPDAVTPEQARRDLEAAENRARKQRRPRTRQRPTPKQPIRVGDTVEVPSLGLEGEVVSIDEATDVADLQVGAFKVQQPLGVLKRVGGKRAEKSRQKAQYSLPAAPVVDNEIHFRGQRAADVEQELERYLDTVAHASLPSVRIVHGKGTGTLRSVVHQVLRRHPSVSRFQLAGANEGGDGVTIAYLAD